MLLIEVYSSARKDIIVLMPIERWIAFFRLDRLHGGWIERERLTKPIQFSIAGQFHFDPEQCLFLLQASSNLGLLDCLSVIRRQVIVLTDDSHYLSFPLRQTSTRAYTGNQ